LSFLSRQWLSRQNPPDDCLESLVRDQKINIIDPYLRTSKSKDLVQKAIENIVGIIKIIDSAVVGDERREKPLDPG
jgi:hypothetical protein